MSSAQDNPQTTQRELESFRRQWQEEVQRGKGKQNSLNVSRQRQSAVTSTSTGVSAQKSTTRLRLPTVGDAPAPEQDEEDEDGIGQGYHDLPNKDDDMKLGSTAEARTAVAGPVAPETALDHYEKAVERETAGRLGDSVSLYRTAFRLDNDVQQAYKNKHFPAPAKPALLPQAKPNPSNASPAVPSTAHHSLTDKLSEGSPTVPATLNDLLDAFSSLSIIPAAPIISNTPPPPCPIADLPSEVLLRILQSAADPDVATLPCLSLVCRKLAYLITTDDTLWKPIALHALTGMHYRYALTLPTPSHSLFPLDSDAHTPIPDLTPTPYPTYRAQFRSRPRLRFPGVYISVNNYPRPGLPAQDRRTWSTPVHIVTYYRYLRFYRDGSCISLQTTAEPADVVHHLTRETLESEKKRERERHGAATANTPSVVMRDALRGRWRISGAASGPSPRLEDADEPLGTQPGEYAKEPVSVFDGGLVDDGEAEEEEGTVHVETEGVNAKYLWKMEFALGSAGRKDGARNTKLAWKGFWSYNRLSDDWAEFGLKNDKSLFWSRVRSWGVGE